MKIKVNTGESDIFQSGFSIFVYEKSIPSFQIAFDNKYGISLYPCFDDIYESTRFMYNKCIVVVLKEDEQGHVVNKTNEIMKLLDYLPTEEEAQIEMFNNISTDFLAKIIKVVTELK